MNITSDIGQSFKDETIPFGHHIVTDYRLWYEWTAQIRAFYQSFIGPNGGRGFIKHHAKTLHPKVCRFSEQGGEHEYYVWEDREDGWRVYVSSGRGIQFEVFHGFDPREAWDKYVGRFTSYRLVEKLMKS